MEIEKVLSDHERDVGELSRLRKLENAGNKKAKMVEKTASKEVVRLTRALQEEKAVKTEAFKKVQMLRDEMQQHAMGDKASVDGQQWMDRYLACCDQLEAMARENDVMRQAFKELGMEPPFPGSAGEPGGGGRQEHGAGTRPSTGLSAVSSPIGAKRTGSSDGGSRGSSRLSNTNGRPPKTAQGVGRMASLQADPNNSHNPMTEAARLTQERGRDMSLSGTSARRPGTSSSHGSRR